MSLRLRNPHSILAAFDTRPESVVEVRVPGARPSGAWAEVVDRAARARVPVIGEAARVTGRRRAKTASGGPEGGRSGTAEAVVKERSPLLLEELFVTLEQPVAQGPPGGPALWLALDQLQDPHNVGAIFRTAAFFCLRGIVLTRDRSAPLSATVYDVAAGGLEYVPFAVETNLSRALVRAKDAGLWILGASEHADQDAGQVPRDRPWLLVLGNEERGLRRLTMERCDTVCRLTPRGQIRSLNVSVAAAVLMATLTQAGD